MPPALAARLRALVSHSLPAFLIPAAVAVTVFPRDAAAQTPDEVDATSDDARVEWIDEALGRWRDLLQHQSSLAGLLPQGEEKTELFRSVARRWMDQFSNVQNATEAYESLLAAAPGDDEAITIDERQPGRCRPRRG